MDNLTTPGGRASMIDRVKAVLLKPKETWLVIAAEPATAGDLFRSYAVPLAAIGPVAGFIGGQVFGYGAFGFSYRPTLIGGLATALVGYVLALVGVFVLAFIANFLAPKFDGVADNTAAMKLVVYSMTASWVAGVFGLIPALGILAIVGLYSFYLYYLGATPVMKVPEAKAGGFTAVTVVCALVIYLVIGAISAPLVAMAGGGMAATSYRSASTDTASVTIPGVGTVDTAKMEAATKQMEAAANGKVPPIDPSKLQALLPASVGGYTRTAVEANGVGGLGASADGTYTAGDKSFHLKVTDMAAMGALAGLGSAMGVSQSKQDAEGYSRTGTVDGHMQTEEWRNSGSGKFGVVIGNRFMVEADGQAGSIDELKAAVAAIDPGALAGLAS